VRLARIPVCLNQSLIRGIAGKAAADNRQVAQNEGLERVDVTAEAGALVPNCCASSPRFVVVGYSIPDSAPGAQRFHSIILI